MGRRFQLNYSFYSIDRSAKVELFSHPIFADYWNCPLVCSITPKAQFQRQVSKDQHRSINQ